MAYGPCPGGSQGSSAYQCRPDFPALHEPRSLPGPRFELARPQGLLPGAQGELPGPQREVGGSTALGNEEQQPALQEFAVLRRDVLEPEVDQVGALGLGALGLRSAIWSRGDVADSTITPRTLPGDQASSLESPSAAGDGGLALPEEGRQAYLRAGLFGDPDQRQGVTEEVRAPVGGCAIDRRTDSATAIHARCSSATRCHGSRAEGSSHHCQAGPASRRS